jgi:2-methylisocitrate lyase-like PEP mutase family enzyme
LGFKALATTSSGFAWSQGLPDSKLSLDQTLAHFESLVAATDLPINADFESGYAKNAAQLARNVTLAVQTGIAGLSIEDSTGEVDRPLHDIAAAVDRIRTARRAIDKEGGDTLLIGRAECLARSAWGAFMRTAQMIAHAGRFDGFKDAVSDAELDDFFHSL